MKIDSYKIHAHYEAKTQEKQAEKYRSSEELWAKESRKEHVLKRDINTL